MKTEDRSAPIYSYEAWCSTDRFTWWREEWRPIPSHGAAPQEIAVSLTSLWLYIPSLCWPEASPLTQMGNIETIMHHKVVGGEEKKKTWHRALLKVIHRFTAHQAEKIYTPTEERDSNMFKPRQTHTRVYGHFFSHRPQAFRQWLWISPWEKVCVCLRLFFFHTKSHSNQYFNSNCMFGFFGGLWCLIIARFGSESQLQIYD